MSKTAKILAELTVRIRQRRDDNSTTSYTAKLLQENEDGLLKKIIEEAGETALAAKSSNRQQLISELADLCYHCLVAMERYNINADEVAAELQTRGKQSGIAEKAARPKKSVTITIIKKVAHPKKTVTKTVTKAIIKRVSRKSVKPR